MPSINLRRPQMISRKGQYCESRSNTGTAGWKLRHKKRPPINSMINGPAMDLLIGGLLGFADRSLARTASVDSPPEAPRPAIPVAGQAVDMAVDMSNKA